MLRRKAASHSRAVYPLPARADDDYIRKLAQLVKFGSDGTLPDDRYAPPFQLAREISRLAPTTGNTAQVLVDSTDRLDSLIADIDAAGAEAQAARLAAAGHEAAWVALDLADEASVIAASARDMQDLILASSHAAQIRRFTAARVIWWMSV